MSKSEAQIKNEAEVRRIMKERSYEFWDEPKKSKKKTPKRKGLVITCSIIILLLVSVGGVFFAKFYIEKMETETKEQLSSCLKEAEQIYYNTSDVTGASPSTLYSSQIECHEKYKTDSYDVEVARLNELKTSSDLNTCLEEASNNYAVSEEERINAGTDVNALLILIKRVGSGIDAKMSCHEKYKTPDYETQMSKLRADKSENEAYIADAENAIRYEQNRPQTIYQQPSSSSVHCSSRSIGSSVYTDCY